MWSHGRRAVTGIVPRYVAGSTPSARERLLPDVHLLLVFPRVEARARAVRALEHVRQRAVAAGEDALEPRRLAVVHPQLDARARAPPPSSQPCFFARRRAASMAHHWKGVCGLGTCVETLTVTFGAPPERSAPSSRACRSPARGRRPAGSRARRSSSSVGRPIMK